MTDPDPGPTRGHAAALFELARLRVQLGVVASTVRHWAAVGGHHRELALALGERLVAVGATDPLADHQPAEGDNRGR